MLNLSYVNSKDFTCLLTPFCVFKDLRFERLPSVYYDFKGCQMSKYWNVITLVAVSIKCHFSSRKPATIGLVKAPRITKPNQCQVNLL